MHVHMQNRPHKHVDTLYPAAPPYTRIITKNTARALGPGHTVVTIICDGGERYLSKTYQDDFLAARGLRNPGAEEVGGSMGVFDVLCRPVFGCSLVFMG